MPKAYTILDQYKIYFVTFTIIKWLKVFEIEDHCRIFIESVKYCQKNKGLEVYAWCIMPNHVHMILGTNGQMMLQDIIRDLKSYTSRKIRKNLEDQMEFNDASLIHLSYFLKQGSKNSNSKDFQMWKHGYHGIELSTYKMKDQQLEYIHNNPVKAGLTDLPENWKWRSAIDYFGGKGLLDIIYL